MDIGNKRYVKRKESPGKSRFMIRLFVLLALLVVLVFLAVLNGPSFQGPN